MTFTEFPQPSYPPQPHVVPQQVVVRQGMSGAAKALVAIAMLFALGVTFFLGMVVGAAVDSAGSTRADARIQCAADNISSPTTRSCH